MKADGTHDDGCPCEGCLGAIIEEQARQLQEIRGTPVAMARSLFDLAEKLGKSKFSSDPPASWIENYIDKQARRLKKLKEKRCSCGKKYVE